MIQCVFFVVCVNTNTMFHSLLYPASFEIPMIRIAETGVLYVRRAGSLPEKKSQVISFVFDHLA